MHIFIYKLKLQCILFIFNTINIICSETSKYQTPTGLKKLFVIESCPLLGVNF